MVPWWWRSDEDDDRRDEIRVERNDPRRTTDEEVNELWWRTWRSERAVVNITSRNLIHLSQCRIAEDYDSGDLLFRSQMHVDEQDEVAPAAQQQKRRNLNALVFL
jgi:hypothetical protein